jgi:serine phosphatase RsbU (regulator of sigma subunit)
VVPIAIQNRVLGAITLAYAESGRRYDGDDLALAESVGRRAAVAIDNARLFRDREEMSTALQRSLLPQWLPHIAGATVAVRYIPFGEAHVVGGDFYDVFEAGENRWGLLIGDVCGKGPEAASVVGIARHTVRGLAMVHSRPSGILAALNRAILDQSPWDRFCTAAYVRLHRTPGMMRATVSLGGHLPLVLRRASGEVELVGEHGSLLGVLEDVHLFDTAVDLAPGDTLVLYTDGLEEQGADTPMADERERVESIVRAAPPGVTADELAQLLVDPLRRRVRRDDAAVMVLRVEG